MFLYRSENEEFPQVALCSNSARLGSLSGKHKVITMLLLVLMVMIIVVENIRESEHPRSSLQLLLSD